MPRASLRVKLLGVTPRSLEIIYSAARQCYYEGWVGDLWQDDEPLSVNDEPIPIERIEGLLRRIMASGHQSVIEHAAFTFAISGVSRALTHQLVRHRIASFSQQSQRYCDSADFEFVIPPRVDANPESRERFLALMRHINDEYAWLQEFLQEKHSDSKVNEDARFTLPNAAASNIVVTMNCRSLDNFFSLRCCACAQWEIRTLACRMLDICHEQLPTVFAAMGPKCAALGYCTEGPRTCGRAPLKEDVFAAWKRSKSRGE